DSLHLLFRLAYATRKHRAAHGMGCGFHHGASWRKVICKAVMHQLARAKTRRIHGACKPPVIGPPAFRLVNGPRRRKYTRSLTPSYGRKAAKNPADGGKLLARLALTHG